MTFPVFRALFRPLLRPGRFFADLPLRPTAAGALWPPAVLALLATAINYGNNLIFALAFLLLAVWLQAAWACRRNLAGALWQGEPPNPVFAGEALAVGGSLRGRDERASRRIALARGGVAGPAADALAPGDATLSIAFAAEARGARIIGDLALVSRYPLGLWQSRRALPAVPAMVYPRPVGDAPLPAATPRPAHASTASDDFQGIRAYAPGDPQRRINWRVWGRRGELVVNRFDGGHGGDALWLDWRDCRGDGESRLAQLARWVIDAERSGRAYGLRLPGTPPLAIAPARGRAHREDCLARLALFDLSTFDLSTFDLSSFKFSDLPHADHDHARVPRR